MTDLKCAQQYEREVIKINDELIKEFETGQRIRSSWIYIRVRFCLTYTAGKKNIIWMKTGEKIIFGRLHSFMFGGR